MEIWYRTGGYGKSPIEAVNVTKTTDKTVTLLVANSFTGKTKERRNAIRSTHDNYFKTWEEARDYLASEAERNVESLRRQLEVAKSVAGNIRGLKKPA